MAVLLRLSLAEPYAQVDLLMSSLWDLQTTGACELASGEIQAAFETEALGLEAMAEVREQFATLGCVATLETSPQVEWDATPKASSFSVVAAGLDISIDVDVDKVFGHGRHPTTRLAIKSLSRIVKPRHTVLDVGTGSGVLAIVSAKLGAYVSALDISAEALETARLNAESNGASVALTLAPLADVIAQSAGLFDCVVANVLLPVHRQLAGDATSALKRGGSLVVSGILDTQQAEIEQIYYQLKLARRDQEGSWVALEFKN